MKLYILEVISDEKYWYDFYNKKLIRAYNETHARNIGNAEHVADEGQIWTDPEKVSCTELLVDGNSGTLLTSFNAG